MGKVKSKWEKLDDKTQKLAKALAAVATIIGLTVSGSTWAINQVDKAISDKIETQTAILQQEVKQISSEREATAKQTDLQLTRLILYIYYNIFI